MRFNSSGEMRMFPRMPSSVLPMSKSSTGLSRPITLAHWSSQVYFYLNLMCLPASVERQHCARDLAGFHRTKRFVDLFERTAPANHIVEIQASLPIQVEIFRHV